MKLVCDDKDMQVLVHALWLDEVPAVLMEITGTGWHIEFLRPSECVNVLALIAKGVVKRA